MPEDFAILTYAYDDQLRFISFVTLQTEQAKEFMQEMARTYTKNLAMIREREAEGTDFNDHLPPQPPSLI